MLARALFASGQVVPDRVWCTVVWIGSYVKSLAHWSAMRLRHVGLPRWFVLPERIPKLPVSVCHAGLPYWSSTLVCHAGAPRWYAVPACLLHQSPKLSASVLVLLVRGSSCGMCGCGDGVGVGCCTCGRGWNSQLLVKLRCNGVASLSLSVGLSVCLSVFRSVCLSVSLSIHRFVCLPVCLPVSLCMVVSV